MKHPIFLLSFVFIGVIACGQTRGDATLFGFRQWVSKGKAPEITEQTQTRISEGAGKNYFLYATSPSKIIPVEAWLEGQRCGLMVTSVISPVMYTDDRIHGAPKKILVPKTRDKVVRLSLLPPAEVKFQAEQAAAMAKTNEFVLVYKKNGKLYYATLEKLKTLESTAAQ